MDKLGNWNLGHCSVAQVDGQRPDPKPGIGKLLVAEVEGVTAHLYSFHLIPEWGEELEFWV